MCSLPGSNLGSCIRYGARDARRPQTTTHHGRRHAVISVPFMPVSVCFGTRAHTHTRGERIFHSKPQCVARDRRLRHATTRIHTRRKRISFMHTYIHSRFWTVDGIRKLLMIAHAITENASFIDTYMIFSNADAAFIFGLLLMYWLDGYLFLFFAVMYSFWIPQIVCNITRGTRAALQTRYVVGMTACRCLLPACMYFCPLVASACCP